MDSVARAGGVPDGASPMKVTLRQRPSAFALRGYDLTALRAKTGSDSDTTADSDAGESVCSPSLCSAEPPEPAAPPPPRGPTGPARTPLSSKACAYIPSAAGPACQGASGRVSPGAVRRPGVKPRLKPPSVAAPAVEEQTTVMMCRVPLFYTRDMLVDLFEAKGFSGHIDFLYVPVKFKTGLGFGYSFVNLTTQEQARRFIRTFDGFDDWESSFSTKACNVRWSDNQGYWPNVARFQNSSLMGEDVPDFYKPALFSRGVRIPFPEPTKNVRKMRAKKLSADPSVEW